MSQSNRLRLAIDIGGTFTDSVIVDADDDLIASNKTLTSHQNPAIAALDGAQQVVAQAGVSLSSIELLVHGTTLATNALIEKRGARIASLTTQGFKDILEIAYERRYSQYDLTLKKPDLLVPPEFNRTLTERMSVSGDVLIPLDREELQPLANWIIENDIEALAVCLLHAYSNSAHERVVADFLAQACPDVSVSLSSDVSPEAREFDRLCTTVANAYIQPLMSHYLVRFTSAFKDAGLGCPILMMTAGGGMTTLETAARFPIRLVESGPAGGAVLAARSATLAGLDQVLSFDMGGTTAKLCLIDNGKPQTARQFEIARAERFIKGSGMPVRIPVVEMIEIGAGGGSIADVDEIGRLTVGPRSAGSEPGPVAFGRGGGHPTVTDADLLQGLIQPKHFAEGRLTLDAESAKKAVDDCIAMPLAIDTADAAAAICQIVDENMASAARMHAVESGKHLGARTMIAFGGNGPLHACRVARAAGISTIVIPPSPGVGSALGFLFAPVSYEIVHTQYALLQSLPFDEINQLLTNMTAAATRIVELGVTNDSERPLDITRTAYMRYRGQGYEIDINLPDRPLQSSDIEKLMTGFEQTYSQLFSRAIPDMQIEVLNWSVQVATRNNRQQASSTSKLVSATGDNAQTVEPANSICRIHCDVTGRLVDAQVVDRQSLRPNQQIAGPALIVEQQTTTFVAADFNATCDSRGDLVMQREAH